MKNSQKYRLVTLFINELEDELSAMSNEVLVSLSKADFDHAHGIMSVLVSDLLDDLSDAQRS